MTRKKQNIEIEYRGRRARQQEIEYRDRRAKQAEQNYTQKLNERKEQLQTNKRSRSDTIFFNKMKNAGDNAGVRGFMHDVQDLYTGRNRGKDRAEAITEAFGTDTMLQAYNKWKKSDRGKLWEALMTVDEQYLLSEGFSQEFIDELRAMTKEDRYNEAIEII